jgi:uncharacterized membrane protein
MLPFIVWFSIFVYRGIVSNWQKFSADSQNATIALISFLGGSIGIFLIFPCLMKMDITLAPRYQFVYFPSVVIIVGFALGNSWISNNKIWIWMGNKKGVLLILCMELLSSLIVASNQGYLKSYAPSNLLNALEKSSSNPVIVATTHNSLTQVGELMSLAWEMQQVRQSDRVNSTKFLLIHQDEFNCEGRDCASTNKLQKVVKSLHKPHDLWLVNFSAPVNLPSTCQIDRGLTGQVRGYKYSVYHCGEKTIGFTANQDIKVELPKL